MSDSPNSVVTNVAAVILAAGKSTRMKSKTPKALHTLLGKPLLRFAVEAVQAAGAERTIIVVGHQSDDVREAMGPDFEYVLQAEQKGTGHAVRMVEEFLAGWTGPVLVMPGDAPLVSGYLLQSLIEHHVKMRAAATLLTAVLDDAGAYGRIVRDPASRQVRAIVEAKDATPEQLKIGEIGTSVYVFEPKRLFTALRDVRPNNQQGEYYLTDVIGMFADQSEIVEALVSPDPDVVRGVNNRIELAELGQTLRERILRTHQHNGVTIIDPATTFIEASVRIGQDTTIHPFTMLSGVTDIGEDCQIGPGARISDARIGNGVCVRDSYVVASEVGDETRIGPYANLRPGNVVGKSVKIGDFVELKQAIIGDGTSVGHLAYLGDADVGARTNIAAGVVTCNFTGPGEPKQPTSIGNNAFIGTNNTLVAPVTIADNAYTAAGSTITDDVPEGALAIGRARQVIKEGWVAERTERTRKVH
ncbi:MAG: bifunctional UDP-N-acetylglucosamine diphosphorylase/glucosamine-1-phosphate N-acetyltransferase GlmU [Capsulimonadaceae bacterium]